MATNANLTYLKWISILPCAILAYFIVFFLSNIICAFLVGIFNGVPFAFKNPYGYDDDTDWNNGGFAEVVSSVLSSFAYMEIGERLTPKYKYKKTVSLILIIILITTLVIISILKLFERKYPIYNIIGTILVCGTFYYNIAEDGTNKKRPDY